MKTLVVFYSKDGSNRKLAEEISKGLGCDMEEIIDTKNRKGILNWILAGRDAFKKLPTKIKPLDKEPKDYERIIIGTPIWAGTMAPAARTFLNENILKDKVLCVFSSCGSGTKQNLLKDVENELHGGSIEKSFVIKQKEVVEGNYEDKVKTFISELR